VKSHLQSRVKMDYRADLLNLRAAFKLKLPHLARGGADQEAAAGG
jgi:hypothetical protein